MKKIFLPTLLLSVGLLSYAFLQNDTVVEKYHVDGLEMIQSSTNPPPARTGAPGEGNCTSCHSGSTMSAEGLAFLTFEGDPNYVPGETYNATITTPEGPKNGFELTILNDDDEKAGHFIAGENTSEISFGGREYVRHSSSLGEETWTFQWVAPEENMGTLTAYYSINKANNNGSTSGDEIFLGSMSIEADGEASIEQELNKSNFQAYFNHSSKTLNLNYSIIEAEKIVLNIQDIAGKLIQTYDFGVEANGNYIKTFDLPQDIEAGTYIVALFVGNRIYNEKLVLR